MCDTRSDRLKIFKKRQLASSKWSTWVIFCYSPCFVIPLRSLLYYGPPLLCDVHVAWLGGYNEMYQQKKSDRHRVSINCVSGSTGDRPPVHSSTAYLPPDYITETRFGPRCEVVPQDVYSAYNMNDGYGQPANSWASLRPPPPPPLQPLKTETWLGPDGSSAHHFR